VEPSEEIRRVIERWTKAIREGDDDAIPACPIIPAPS
jgi:ketosteroid isomerase-like protein